MTAVGRTRQTGRGTCERARVRPTFAVRACPIAGVALVFSGGTRGAHTRVRVPCIAHTLGCTSTRFAWHAITVLARIRRTYVAAVKRITKAKLSSRTPVVAVRQSHTNASEAVPARRVGRTRGTHPAYTRVRPVAATLRYTVAYISATEICSRKATTRTCRAGCTRTAVLTVIHVVASAVSLVRTAVACCRIHIAGVAVLAGAGRTRQTGRGTCERARVRPTCAVRARVGE